MAETPMLVARFALDAAGRPIFEADDQDLRHYDIELEVTAAPEAAYGAVFELDPTYYDQVRTITRGKDGRLVLDVASYGDYPVRVRFLTKEAPVAGVTAELSSALALGHPQPSAALTAALKDIKDN